MEYASVGATVPQQETLADRLHRTNITLLNLHQRLRGLLRRTMAGQGPRNDPPDEPIHTLQPNGPPTLEDSIQAQAEGIEALLNTIGALERIA